MPTTRTLLYILIFLIINPLAGFSQKKAEEWRYEGPRVGIDLSRFLVPFVQDADRSAWEIQADIPLKGNWFPTIETGMQWYDDKKENFHYQNSGVYGRIGADLNILKFESLSDGDLVFIGLRYGYSRFTQQADSIKYSNYWGELLTSVPERNMNAHWGEIVFGMKGEIFRNIFLGWTFRGKFILSQTKDPNMEPYIIPGIGKTTSSIPFDLSFGIYYRFPLFKSKTIPKPIQMGGSKNNEEEENEDYQDPNSMPGSGGSNFNMNNLRSGTLE